MIKKNITFILVLILVMINTFSVSIGAKMSLSTGGKRVVMHVGDKRVVKVTKIKQKAKWKIVAGKGNVKIVKKAGKYKNKVTLLAKKTGTSVIQIKVGNKKRKIRIVIRKKETGTSPVIPAETTTESEATNIETTTQGASAETTNHIETDTATTEETSEIIDTTTTEETSEIIDTTTVEETEKIYATVTFDCGGLAEKITKQVKIGEPYGELPIPEVEDYTFWGWQTEYYAGTKVTEDDICTGDITLYATLYSSKGVIHHETKIYWIITMDYDGLLENTSEVFVIGEPYGTLPEPEVEGYTFLGWFSEYHSPDSRVTADDICTKEATLYAWFEKINPEE